MVVRHHNICGCRLVTVAKEKAKPVLRSRFLYASCFSGPTSRPAVVLVGVGSTQKRKRKLTVFKQFPPFLCVLRPRQPDGKGKNHGYGKMKA